jgi:flagellar hook-associated protein 3 FlgL
LPPPVELADGEFLSYAMRADAEELKAMMRGLAMAAVVVDPVGVTGPAQELSREQVMSLLDTAGKTILKATDDITMTRSELGLAEGRIEAAQSRTTAQRATLELARADLIGVDAYEAATRVTRLQSQLEAIYAMTARSSQLSLLNFLR